MECPKCNNEVSEHDKICPHCNKVLLLECPICHKLSRTPLCDECGFVIISKCHKCGQLNKTINGKCKKCGFSTYKSISMNESETDEFACLAISFPNLDDLRPALKNKQIFNKFYKKLKSNIFNYAKGQDNRAQLIDGAFIIKYYKEFSFSSSVNKAVNSALELMNKIAAISYKFKKSKGIKMACKMTILKRNLDNDNDSFNTGLNIKLINTDAKKEDYCDGLQFITDQFINTIISRQYKLELIYSSQVNDELLEFYEFPLKENIIPIIDEEDNDDKVNILTKPKELPKISELHKEEEEIDLYANRAIDIKTMCEFLSIPGIDIPDKIRELLSNQVFITIKSSNDLAISSDLIINAISSVNNKVLHVVCSDGFVYEPYAFFKELIASYLCIDTKLANLDAASRSKIKSFDNDELIFNLLIHEPLKDIDPQEALSKYMEIFYKFIELQKGSVIFIENFDFIDEMSLEILIAMLSDFKNLGISFVITVNKDYIVHKEIKELLYLDAYKEITVIKTEFERLLATISEDIDGIKDSFYFAKIKDQFLGSTLYFQNAFQYLRDTNIFITHDNKLLLNSEKTIIFPSSLFQLMIKRYEALEENECFVLAYAAYLGNNMIIGLLNDLGIDKLDEAIKSLREKKFITCNNFIIEVQNYRLIQACVKEFLSDDVKELIINNICEKLNTKTINVIKSMGLISESNITVYNLSQYALSHGDFNAYLRNCKKFLGILDNLQKNEFTQELKDAKANIYNTLSLYLNKYPSHKIYAISKIIFEACLRKKNDKKIMEISSLMLDSALLDKNYILAQQSLHHVLIRMLNPEISENEENILVKSFFYDCINVKILFNSGKFKNCIEALDKIFLNITQDLFIQLGRSGISKNDFVNYFMEILNFGALARVFIADCSLNEFFEKVNYMFSIDVPVKYAALKLQELIHNGQADIDDSLVGDNTLSKVIISIIKSVISFDGDYNAFAQNIYNAKLLSRTLDDNFWSLICDLFIGYSYQKLNSNIKASVIYADVISITQKTGMGYISFLANYFVSSLKYEIKDLNVALKLITDLSGILAKSSTDTRLLAIWANILQVNIVVERGVFDVDLEPIIYKIEYACKTYNMEYLKEYLIDYSSYIEQYKIACEIEESDNSAVADSNTVNNMSESLQSETSNTNE